MNKLFSARCHYGGQLEQNKWGHIERMREMRNTYEILAEKHERDHSVDLVRNRRINNKMVLKETGAGWIYMAENRVQWWIFFNMVMNLRIP